MRRSGSIIEIASQISTALVLVALQGCVQKPASIDNGLLAADAKVSAIVKAKDLSCAPAGGMVFRGTPIATPPGHPYPFYPPQMEETGQEAVAAVSCGVDTVGHLSNCILIANEGSPLAGQALMAWLTLPGLQFPPAMAGNTAVATCHTWKMRFALAKKA